MHPGEVNKIREFEASPNLIVTHSDAPELFVWNVDTQANKVSGKAAEEGGSMTHSKPDLVLVGHEENAEFALAVHRQVFHVASGGKDQQAGPRRSSPHGLLIVHLYTLVASSSLA